MKNKLKIFLCVVMILVFSFGTCSVAFAATGAPKTLEMAMDIYNSYEYSVNLHPVFYYYSPKDDDYFLFFIGDNCQKRGYVQYTKAYGSDGISTWSSFGKWQIYKFDHLNCYSKPILVAQDLDDVYGSTVGYGLDLENIKKNIIGSYVDVLDYDGNLVFQQGTKPSPNPTTPDISTPGSNTLSTMFNKNSAMLKGVLNEIVALLPLLLPVLISFLAIRKGIKFTLQTLRSS